jgi:hypothetical protein
MAPLLPKQIVPSSKSGQNNTHQEPRHHGYALFSFCKTGRFDGGGTQIFAVRSIKKVFKFYYKSMIYDKICI